MGAFPSTSSLTGWKQLSAADRFFDTNILLCLLSGDNAKADRAEDAWASGGIISFQVLNEFASVAARKIKMSIAEILAVLTAFRAVFKIVIIYNSIAYIEKGRYFACDKPYPRIVSISRAATSPPMAAYCCCSSVYTLRPWAMKTSTTIPASAVT